MDSKDVKGCTYGRGLGLSGRKVIDQEPPPPPQEKPKPKDELDQQMVLMQIIGNTSDQEIVNTLTPALISISRVDTREIDNPESQYRIGEPLDKNLSHLAEVGACFRELFTHNRLSDVTIQIENDRFMVHKATLMAHSEYFCKVFFKGKKDLTTIQLTGIPTPAFQLVLEYMYTGKVAISMENIADIFTTGQKLLITNLLTICNRKLNNLSARSALVLLHHATDKDSDICRRAFSIVAMSFQSIKDSQQLKMQRVSMFMVILECDNIVVVSEMDVFNSVITWLYADYNYRLKYINKVLSLVRYCYMTSSDLLTCTDIIKDLPTWAEVQPFLLKSLWYSIATRHRRKPLIPMTMPPTRKYQIKTAEMSNNTNVNNLQSQNVIRTQPIGDPVRNTTPSTNVNTNNASVQNCSQYEQRSVSKKNTASEYEKNILVIDRKCVSKQSPHVEVMDEAVIEANANIGVTAKEVGLSNFTVVSWVCLESSDARLSR